MKPSPRTVLTAVVKEARAELRLNNPDFRCVGLMFADGLEALAERAERIPEPVEVRVSEPNEIRTRHGRKGEKEKGRKGE